MVEVPSSTKEDVYDQGAFNEFQRVVGVRLGGSEDMGEQPEDSKAAVVKEEDRRPRLQDVLTEKGYRCTVEADQLKGRYFAVIDGNHRLSAIQHLDPDVYSVEHVRCGVVQLETVHALVEAGTLLNLVRGIQAQENFQDRCVWIRMHVPIYKGVLKLEQEEWDKQNPNANAKQQKRERPKWTVKNFHKWAAGQPGPIFNKPYGSTSVLIKVALNMHPETNKFIASKFARSAEEALVAEECYTKAALGQGAFWNKTKISAEDQLWWVRSMFEVERNKTRLDIKYKGTAHAAKFESLCTDTIAQQKKFARELARLKTQFPVEVTDIAFPSSRDSRLTRLLTTLQQHKWAEHVRRKGRSSGLIKPLQEYVNDLNDKMEKEKKQQDQARKTKERVAELLAEKQRKEKEKEAQRKRDAALREMKVMKEWMGQYHTCEQFLSDGGDPPEGCSTTEEAKKMQSDLLVLIKEYPAKLREMHEEGVLATGDQGMVDAVVADFIGILEPEDYTAYNIQFGQGT